MSGLKITLENSKMIPVGGGGRCGSFGMRNWVHGGIASVYLPGALLGVSYMFVMG